MRVDLLHQAHETEVEKSGLECFSQGRTLSHVRVTLPSPGFPTVLSSQHLENMLISVRYTKVKLMSLCRRPAGTAQGLKPSQAMPSSRRAEELNF